jgi:COP9 signalosome complex subunit 4
MEGRLAQLRSLAQKDKAPAYSALLTETLSQQDPASVARDVHTLVQAVLTEDHVGIVAGRQVLSDLVKYLVEGAVKDTEVKKEIVKDILVIAQPRSVSFEEQVSPFVRCLMLDSGD